MKFRDSSNCEARGEGAVLAPSSRTGSVADAMVGEL